jgi:hypothetical protein
MEDVKRAVLTILSVLSLLLFVALAGLWVRSHLVAEHVVLGAADGGGYYVAQSAKGGISVGWYSNWDHGGRWIRYDVRPGRAAARRKSAATRYRSAATVRREFLGVGYYSGTYYTWPSYLYPNVVPPPPQTDPRWMAMGFRSVGVSYASIIVLLLLPSAYACRMFGELIRDRRRRRAGYCRGCGYDLRATPERCPECGTSVRVHAGGVRGGAT